MCDRILFKKAFYDFGDCTWFWKNTKIFKNTNFFTVKFTMLGSISDDEEFHDISFRLCYIVNSCSKDRFQKL